MYRYMEFRIHPIGWDDLDASVAALGQHSAPNVQDGVDQSKNLRQIRTNTHKWNHKNRKIIKCKKWMNELHYSLLTMNRYSEHLLCVAFTINLDRPASCPSWCITTATQNRTTNSDINQQFKRVFECIIVQSIPRQQCMHCTGSCFCSRWF